MAISPPEANKEGVWFEDQGEVLITGEKWIIAVEINLTETRQEVAELHGRTEDTAFLLKQATEKLPALEVQHKVLKRIMSMEDELKDIVQTLTDLYYGRNRRGLINLGGKILHVLFGVAENEDLEKVQHSEELTKLKTASLIHIEGEHLTVTRELSRKTERNHQELGRVSQEVYGNITVIMNQLLTTNKKTMEVDNLLHVYMDTSTALEELELATFKALLDLRRVLQCLNDAANGKLSMNLISPLELRNILLKVRSSLPSGLELVFGTDISQVLNFYQLIKTCAVTSGEVIKILLTVPLSSIGRRFDMFQALALPVKDFHTNVSVRYQLDSTILLVSKDRDRYSLLSEVMLEQCDQVGSLTLCPAFSPLYARHHPSCLSSLFLGEMKLARQHCTRLVLTKDPPDAWVWRRSDNSWIYSLSTERRFVSQCKTSGQTTVEELHLHGTGAMRAIRGCTLSHPSYQIPAPTSLGGRTEVRLRPVAIDIPAALSLAEGRFSASQIHLELARRQQEGHAWPGTSGVEEVTVNHLIRSLRMMEAVEPTDQLTHYWYYVITAVTMVIALTGGGVAWRLLTRKTAPIPSGEEAAVPLPQVTTTPQVVTPSHGGDDQSTEQENGDPTYMFSYATDTHSRDESSDAQGNVKGVFSFVDANGVRQNVEYEANNESGFVVKKVTTDSATTSSGGDDTQQTLVPVLPPRQDPIPPQESIPPQEPIPTQEPLPPNQEYLPVNGLDEEANDNSDASYSFSYNAGDHSREETSDSRGSITGSYTFVSKDDGATRRVDYTAGANQGFIAKGSHLPVADNGLTVSNTLPQGVVPLPQPQALPLPLPLQNQGKAQIRPDGSYTFSYVANDHSRSETSDASGNVQGFYTVGSANGGNVRRIDYTAGAGTGFLATGDGVPPNLPVPVPNAAPLPVQPQHQLPFPVQTLPQLPKALGEASSSETLGALDGSYAFTFQADDHSREEAADSINTVKGSYTFISKDDNINRRVDYVAGAKTGFIATLSKSNDKTLPKVSIETSSDDSQVPTSILSQTDTQSSNEPAVVTSQLSDESSGQLDGVKAPPQVTSDLDTSSQFSTTTPKPVPIIKTVVDTSHVGTPVQPNLVLYTYLPPNSQKFGYILDTIH